MTSRLPIETAPKDGTVIIAWREIGGERMFEGRACWRTVAFPPIFGEPGFVATGWMHPEKDKRRPEPTHWHPE